MWRDGNSMKCPLCKSKSRVRKVQNDDSRNDLPAPLRELNITRRGYICNKDEDHRFWSIEALEDVWNIKEEEDDGIRQDP